MSTAIKEKEESEQLLEQKMERWVYLHDLAEHNEAQWRQRVPLFMDFFYGGNENV